MVSKLDGDAAGGALACGSSKKRCERAEVLEDRGGELVVVRSANELEEAVEGVESSFFLWS